MVTPLTGDGMHDGMDGDLIDKQMRRRSHIIHLRPNDCAEME